MSKVKIIETQRDGIQGITKFIPTQTKIDIVNTLLKAGFEAVEVGSFVSSEAIPQLKDTSEVINGLDLQNTSSKIMVLAGNEKGALTATNYPQVDQVIFPFSVSETFLKRNIKAGFKDGWERLLHVNEILTNAGKELVPYLTMGFGNPYGDEWSVDIVVEWVGKLIETGTKIIPLSDITGEANPDKIYNVYSYLIRSFPDAEFGLHLHSVREGLFEKLDAAWDAGCRRYDTVCGGLGGCPMTGKELLTNLDTWDLIAFLELKKLNHGIDIEVLRMAGDFIEGIIDR
jgi:hydroxymethylglutaryl-CoA lyase